MSLLDDVLAANAAYAEGFTDGDLAAEPRRRVAVLTCMDARLEPLAALGLDLGDAHVIRNAGGIATDDAVRSLTLSQRALGTEVILVIPHTECGVIGLNGEALADDIEAETGERPPFTFGSLVDAPNAAKRAVGRLRACPYLPHRDRIIGLVHDVATGRIEVVDPA